MIERLNNIIRYIFSVLRKKTPFILIVINLIGASWYNYEYYLIYNQDYEQYYLNSYYVYYSQYFFDTIGCSLITGFYMLSNYMNNSYCAATKVCVWCLIVLNLYNIMSIGMDFYHPIFDFYIITLTLVILFTYKLQPKNKK